MAVHDESIDQGNAEALPPSDLDQEVDYTDVVGEETAAPPAAEAKAVEDAKEELDILVPKADPHTWTFGPEDMEFTFVQKPLSFIGKAQWFALVGEALDKALSGPNGMSINSLLSAPTRGGQMSITDFRDADMFVQAVGKLLSAAPNFLVESYCIWLNVPDYQRRDVADIMKLPEDEGGLSDEQGMEIIEVFIDQNYEALRRFFSDRLGNLAKRVRSQNARFAESRR